MRILVKCKIEVETTQKKKNEVDMMLPHEVMAPLSW